MDSNPIMIIYLVVMPLLIMALSGNLRKMADQPFLYWWYLILLFFFVGAYAIKIYKILKGIQ